MTKLMERCVTRRRMASGCASHRVGSFVSMTFLSNVIGTDRPYARSDVCVTSEYSGSSFLRLGPDRFSSAFGVLKLELQEPASMCRDRPSWSSGERGGKRAESSAFCSMTVRAVHECFPVSHQIVHLQPLLRLPFLKSLLLVPPLRPCRSLPGGPLSDSRLRHERDDLLSVERDTNDNISIRTQTRSFTHSPPKQLTDEARNQCND